MRAEAQANVDQINAATALLRRFLDWDRAQKRLKELNAKVEDPTLWDNPKAAQDVMRERRRLEEAMGATQKIERELADTVELMELAESEGDEALVERVRELSSSLGGEVGISAWNGFAMARFCAQDAAKIRADMITVLRATGSALPRLWLG